MLELNDTAPDFSLELTSGREFNLYSSLKNCSVLINFIRGTWCEECTRHLKQVEQWKEKLDQRINPVATIIVTVEEAKTVKPWLRENPISYMMACDPQGDVAKSFGYMVPEDAYSKPGMVLIDRDKRIRIISEGLKKPRDEVQELLGF